MPASILRKRDKLMDFSLSLFLLRFVGLKVKMQGANFCTKLERINKNSVCLIKCSTLLSCSMKIGEHDLRAKVVYLIFYIK